MTKQNYRLLSKLLLVTLCTMSTLLTSWAAGPGEGLAETESTAGVSKVVTCGGGITGTEQDKDAEPASKTAEASANTQAPAVTGKKGASLGRFTTTGYCNCSKCSGGHNLTYSGTVPKANHTLSADLDLFPIGTKLMINDVIYTVEDMGSGVNGNKLDIYYASHEEAVKHGMIYNVEVFAVE